jgi:hypothetical protein
MEAELPQNPQQKKQQNNSDQSVRQKIMAAKTALGLKDTNLAAAVSGHRKVQTLASKNPQMPFNQVLTRLTPKERENYISVASRVPSDSLDKKISMSQFRRQLNILKSSRPLMNSVEFTDKEQITETLKDEIQPPPMLVLRRKGIRIFPDGRRVAMYTNDKLGLVFTIPYTPSNVSSPVTIPGVQAEETDIMESLEQVAAYAQQENPKSTSKHMKFADGSKLKVSHGAAKAIHMVHDALNDENKKKFADMLSHPKGFEKAAHFAMSRVKFTIGDK